MMETLERIRERQAKMLVDWINGKSPHPHGKSGENWIIPSWEGKDMRDAKDYRYSEWGALAGIF
jgi:hypothetical protein